MFRFQSSAGPDFWWSNSKYQLYYLKRTHKQDYDVTNVGQMYILVRVDDQSQPVHFHTQYMDRPGAGKPQLSFKSYPKVP